MENTQNQTGSVDAAFKRKVIEAHRKRGGKLEMIGKVTVSTSEELSIYYTPGVALACMAIKEDKNQSYELTARANTIAIITDGTRILGLGNIGPEASMPVMEGKALLFKKYGGVDAVPIAISVRGEDEIVNFVKAIAPSFGGINIEDIESPKVFNIVERLSRELDIPVLHDDRYGTGVVALAGMINALKLVGKSLGSASIVINGAGSAGMGITELLLEAGARNIIMCDSNGAIYEGRQEGMNDTKGDISKRTNRNGLKGSLDDVISGADVLIGVSVKSKFTKELISKMAKDPIVFALSNPNPEMSYEEMLASGVAIGATGRSNTPNQINNHLAFPGIMRGLLDSRTRRINPQMLIAASRAIASSVPAKALSKEHIMPNFQEAGTRITANVATAVFKAAIKTGAATIKREPKEVKKETIERLKRYSKMEKRLHLSENA